MLCLFERLRILEKVVANGLKSLSCTVHERKQPVAGWRGQPGVSLSPLFKQVHAYAMIKMSERCSHGINLWWTLSQEGIERGLAGGRLVWCCAS